MGSIELPGDAELFHTDDGAAFIDLIIDEHRETWSVRSSRFRSWLRRRHYEATGEAADPGVVSSALNLLEARAQFDGPERPVYLRVAEQNGRIYLDLADESWCAVEIGSDRWQVVTRPPVRFRRTAGMLPLAKPVPGGSIETLASFLNVVRRDDFLLVVAWLLASMRCGGPYPTLALSGEQGSTKTVFSKMVRGLIDPNVAPVRATPREERDLFIAASNGHVLAFDNLSELPAWTSDALCRLASGGSFAVRRLYTNQDEVLFRAARPIILNGIENVINRPDLADRAIFLTLPHVPEGRRRPEKEVWRDFELARPQILGALMDGATQGLRRRAHVRLQGLPRMADFALWATACEAAFCGSGGFMAAYQANRRAAVEDVIEADALASQVWEMMCERATWTGSASDLLRFGANRGESVPFWRAAEWPKSPRALAGRLRRAQTPLRALGIEVTFSREGRAGTRVITLKRSRPTSSMLGTVSTVSDRVRCE